MTIFNAKDIHHQARFPHLLNTARTLRKNQTLHELRLWQRLRRGQLGVKFRRQYLISNQYIADFVCLEKKLIIEVDGSQHAESQPDKVRTDILTKRGFTVLRFWNIQIDQNLDECIEAIFQHINGKIV